MIDENNEYVAKSNFIITVKTLSECNDSNRQVPIKQTNKQTDSETQKQANIQAEKTKDILTGRCTDRLTS